MRAARFFAISVKTQVRFLLAFVLQKVLSSQNWQNCCSNKFIGAVGCLFVWAALFGALMVSSLF